MHRKQPSKRIRLADYFSDSSMLHDIVVVHMVNNFWHQTVLGTIQMKPLSIHTEHLGLAISDCAFTILLL